MLSLFTITGRLGLGKWVIDWGKQSRVKSQVCPWRVRQFGVVSCRPSLQSCWCPPGYLGTWTLGGRRYRLSIDIVVGYSEDKEKGWLSSSLLSSRLSLARGLKKLNVAPETLALMAEWETCQVRSWLRLNTTREPRSLCERKANLFVCSAAFRTKPGKFSEWRMVLVL